MTRKQSRKIFWIAFISLNLVPLVATGEPTKPAKTDKAPAKTEEKKVEPKDLSLQDLMGSVINHGVKMVGSNPESKAMLMGRVFTDCADKLEISHEGKDAAGKGNEVPGCGNAIAFRVQDKGFTECMAKHKEAGDKCSGTTCVDLETIKNGTLDLAKYGEGPVKLAHVNHDARSDERNTCDELAPALRHETQQSIDGREQLDREEAQGAKIRAQYETLSTCAVTENDISLKRSACVALTALGEFESAEQCVARSHLDRDEFKLLQQQARRGAIDDLPSVGARLASWINEHPKDCKKAVSAYGAIANRLVNKKTRASHRSRSSDFYEEDEVNPLESIETAQDIIDGAIDSAPCLEDYQRMNVISFNIAANHSTKNCELNGLYACAPEYNELVNYANQDFYRSCTGFEMDPFCTAAAENLQKAAGIPNYLLTSDMRKRQQQAQIYQMIQQSQMASMNGGHTGYNSQQPMPGTFAPNSGGPGFQGQGNGGFAGFQGGYNGGYNNPYGASPFTPNGSFNLGYGGSNGGYSQLQPGRI